MRLKIFRAPAMAQAIALVRAELGTDALILATRRVGDGVEITAALEPDEPAAPVRSADPALAAALEYHGVPGRLRSGLQESDLAAGLSDVIKFSALPLDDRPLLLVGPPGAGKTLTVARLATRLVMAGVNPMVVTADGQRAGATGQLAAFTRLLGINLIVACHPVTLGRALTHRRGAAPVIIDSPGRDPFMPADNDEVVALAGASNAALVVVLPAGLDPAEAEDMAGAYIDVGARLLVATRLDLARRLGGVLAAAAAGLALSEVGIGPGAANGLLTATPEWLAVRLLTGVPS